MPSDTDQKTEDTGAEPVSSTGLKKPPRQFIRSGLRKLTEKETTSPAVVEVLLEDVDRLEQEKNVLVTFRDKYYSADKKAAILESQISSWQRGDVLYTICIAIGSALLGGAPSFTGIQFYFLLVTSAILLGGALIFRFWQKSTS